MYIQGKVGYNEESSSLTYSNNELDNWTISSTEGGELTSLYIDNISKLPSGIHHLPKLTHLNASSIPVSGSLPQMPSTLQTVYLNGCGLTDITGLTNCDNLVSVYLQDNYLTTLSPLANSYHSIYTLNVNWNNLENDAETDFTKFTRRMHLLHIGYNKLKKLIAPQNVSHLYFVGNPFTEALPDLSQMWGSVNVSLDPGSVPASLPIKRSDTVSITDFPEMDSASKLKIAKTFPEKHRHTHLEMPTPSFAGGKFTSPNGNFTYDIVNESSLSNSQVLSSKWLKEIHNGINRWDEVITQKPYAGWTNHIEITFRDPDFFSSSQVIANCGFGFRNGRSVTFSDVFGLKDTQKSYVVGNAFIKRSRMNWNVSWASQMVDQYMQNGITAMASTTAHELGHGIGIGSFWSFG